MARSLLLGSTPHMRTSSRSVALLLIDVINDFDFMGAEGMVRNAERVVGEAST